MILALVYKQAPGGVLKYGAHMVTKLLNMCTYQITAV
jgi:hypothetical protein